MRKKVLANMYHRLKDKPVVGFLIRIIGWWLAFAGIYAMSAVCPCCGQVGCPVGASGAGLVGGVMAVGIQNWKKVFKTLKKNKRQPYV